MQIGQSVANQRIGGARQGCRRLADTPAEQCQRPQHQRSAQQETAGKQRLARGQEGEGDNSRKAAQYPAERAAITR